jgi:anti-sigma regulatory factor (Ser/Thr protein kinase)
MTGNDTAVDEKRTDDPVPDRIVLESQLSELIRVSPWIEALAARFAIPENVVFAMNLCLEEALSNVIRHGHRGQGGSLTIQLTVPHEGRFMLIVDDDAPWFNPLEQEPPPAYAPDNPTQIGGQGIRLIRGFSDSLEYSATPTGNQLRIGFSSTSSPK